MTWKLGIDIGGTNFAIGAVDDKGNVIDHIEHLVGDSRNLDIAVKIIAKLADKLTDKMGSSPTSIGAGVPGLVNFANQSVTILPHFPEWKNAPVGKYLSEAFKQNVLIDNDANLATLAELKFGAGKKFKNFVFMTLGTGIGGGLVMDGKLFRGETGFAGEIGHMVINAMDDRMCPCGGKGCFEMFASGKAVPYLTKYLTQKEQNVLKKELGDKQLTAKLAFDLAKNGNHSAISLWNEYGFWLGLGMATLGNVLGTGNFILGGNVSQAFDFFSQNAIKTAKKFSHVLRCSEINFMKSNLGPMAGIIGASQLK